MLALLLSALLVVPPPVEPVLDALREDPVYVSPDSTLTVDEERVREALRRTAVPTYVAVVPQAAVDGVELGIDGYVLQLVDGLEDPRAVVVVVTDGEELQAFEGGESGVDVEAVLDRVLQERIDEPFGPESMTGALVDVAALVDEQAPERRSTRRTVGVVGLLATVVLGGGGLLYARSQRRLRAEAPLTDDEDAARPGWG